MLGDGTAPRTICGMEAKINSIQMLSQMVWARSMGPPLDLADLICLNPTEITSLTKTSPMGTMARATAEAASAAVVVDFFLVAAAAGAS